MRVRVQPADYGGCGYYRLRWPAAALTAHGVNITLHDRQPEGRYIDQHNGITRLASVDCDADVLVLQRPMERRIVEAIPVLQAQGTAVVVEIDDDFSALPKAHPARKDTAAMANPDYNRLWLTRACAAADLVTVSTPALAERYGAHGRVAVIPNYVPARYLTVTAPDHRGVTVGWTGSTQTHVGDLDVCGDGITQALRHTGASFHVVGTGIGVRAGLQLDDEPGHTGWVEIDRYPAEYAALDVAIVPLALNRFNEAKSWLKGLEAAALGVPCVASPTGPYRQLAELGACGLAASPYDWAARVARLASDRHLRDHEGAAAREVAAGLTIEGNAWRWLEAWEHATVNRRGSRAA